MFFSLWLRAIKIVLFGVNTRIEMNTTEALKWHSGPCIWMVILLFQHVPMLMFLDDRWIKAYFFKITFIEISKTLRIWQWTPVIETAQPWVPTLLPCSSQPFHTNTWEMHQTQLMGTESRGQGWWCIPVWLLSLRWGSVLSEKTRYYLETQAFILGSVTQQQQEAAVTLAVPWFMVSFLGLADYESAINLLLRSCKFKTPHYGQELGFPLRGLWVPEWNMSGQYFCPVVKIGSRLSIVIS